MPKELELKLALIPEMAQILLSKGLLNGAVFGPACVLTNTYYDTPDQQLKSLKMALRVRRLGDQWIQTLKSAGASSVGGLTQRGEWEWELQSSELDVAIVKNLLPEGMDLSTLSPVFSTNFTRYICMISRQASLVEIALDQGEVVAGQYRAPICELELELKSGHVSILYQLATEIAEQVAVRIGVKSKAQRAQMLLKDNPSKSGTDSADVLPLASSFLESDKSPHDAYLDCTRQAAFAFEQALESTLEPPNESVHAIELRSQLLHLLSWLHLSNAPNMLLDGFANLLGQIALVSDLQVNSDWPLEVQQQIQRRQHEQLTSLQSQTQVGVLSLALARWLNEVLK